MVFVRQHHYSSRLYRPTSRTPKFKFDGIIPGCRTWTIALFLIRIIFSTAIDVWWFFARADLFQAGLNSKVVCSLGESLFPRRNNFSIRVMSCQIRTRTIIGIFACERSDVSIWNIKKFSCCLFTLKMCRISSTTHQMFSVKSCRSKLFSRFRFDWIFRLYMTNMMNGNG